MSQKFSAEQVSSARLYDALSLEYVMNAIYSMYYDDGFKEFPPWLQAHSDLQEAALARAHDLLPVKLIETWGDELIIQDFQPIASRIAALSAPGLHKLAFLSISFVYILRHYLDMGFEFERQAVQSFISDLEQYLNEAWQTDLEHNDISPILVEIHEPLAREFADRWRIRVESLLQA